MVGWEEKREALPALQTAAAGGAAGAVTRAILQPLDVLKVRFQLQTEPLRNTASSKYSSLLQASALIIREEGVKTLWSGHTPAQFLSISFGLIQFLVFEQLTEAVCKARPRLCRERAPAVHFACGALAACTATLASFPFDTLRTRLIAEHAASPAYASLRGACRTMWREEGPRALYRGAVPALAQIAPNAGIQFATYHILSDLFSWAGVAGNLTAGGVAGFTAKLAVYPLDTIKKRLQIQGFQRHRTRFGRQFYCAGFVDCVRGIVRSEGAAAMYKGLSPSLAKAGLASALHFATYDAIKDALSPDRPS